MEKVVILRTSEENMLHWTFVQKLEEEKINYEKFRDSEYGDFTKFHIINYIIDKKDEPRALDILRCIPAVLKAKEPNPSKMYKIGLYGMIFFAIILIIYAIIIFSI